MIKKHQIPKTNIHTVKMPRKCIAMPTIDIVQLIGNQRKSKRRQQQHLCLFVQVTESFNRSDDQVTQQLFNSKHIIYNNNDILLQTAGLVVHITDTRAQNQMCLAIHQRTLQKQCLHMTNTGRSKAVYPHHSCMCIVIIIKQGWPTRRSRSTGRSPSVSWSIAPDLD